MKQGVVFLMECCVDGCYSKNTFKKNGKQMCKDHQAQYDKGIALTAFYGRIVQRKEFQPKTDQTSTHGN